MSGADARAPAHGVTLAPLAPIIVRSGRPFDGQNGPDAARFPPPSTLAGCLRSAWARTSGTPFSPELARLGVAGPLLARDTTVLVPKPADALYVGRGDAARCVRAAPQPFAASVGADLPEGLLAVQVLEPVTGKQEEGPDWWTLDHFLAFRGGEAPGYAALAAHGWSPPPGDRRTHVAIDTERGAARDGALFQTEGLDFGDELLGDGTTRAGARLLARFAEPITPAIVPLGGERRVAALAPAPTLWPEPPPGWAEAVRDAGGLSLTLVTPGALAAGYRPGWLDAALEGCPPECPRLALRLRAAAVSRWLPHSGWDLARRQARPTRKLAAAGSVYWFELLEPASADAETLRALWLTSLCDERQDRLDGFALAVPGPWRPPA